MIIEDLLNRARKVKVHLVLAAQDTTQGGIGIKNTNLAAGIAFKCENWQTSKAIIGETYAVSLSGKGSMYFKCDELGGPIRLQGSFMSPDEIIDRLDTMNFILEDKGKTYDEVMFELNPLQKHVISESDYETSSIEDEKLFMEIVMWIQDKTDVSNNQLKHNFEMGYERANRFLVRLEDARLISALKKGSKKERIVYQEEVRRFLNSHRDIDESDLSQDTDIAELQEDKEAAQEHYTESIVEGSDFQEKEKDSESAFLTQSKTKRHIQIDEKFIKEHTNRYKGKKRPKH